MTFFLSLSSCLLALLVAFQQQEAISTDSTPSTTTHFITFLGVENDITDFSALGKQGYWFPGVDCDVYSFEKPTNFNEMNGLLAWAGPLKHIERWQLTEYRNRSFSMDGPCSTICGDVNFSKIILPGATSFSTSGIIVDPAADENSNNSVNRIQLNAGTPADSFILSIMVDNCAQQHSAIHAIIARGETAAGTPVESDVVPPLSGDIDAFNGVPDLYRFQFTGFGAGDYIKIKLNGQAGRVRDGGGASFGGLLFD